tara:strand:- start:2703 stop:3089 length:387 start_codon:yes stop_codon:yes gene_type:complete
MKYLKMFEEYLPNKSLYVLSKKARDILNDQEKLNGCFSDYCDMGSEILSKLLEEENISHSIVYGDRYHQYEDSEPDYYGHNWVEVVDDNKTIILDPTIEQFDSNKYLITDDDDEFYNYEKTRVVSNFS